MLPADLVLKVIARVRNGELGRGTKLFSEGEKVWLTFKGLDFDEHRFLSHEQLEALAGGATLDETIADRSLIGNPRKKPRGVEGRYVKGSYVRFDRRVGDERR